MNNNTQINEVAYAIQQIEEVEVRNEFANTLFDLMNDWINKKARREHQSLNVIHGDYHQLVGAIQDGILRWVNDPSSCHAPYDPALGNFTGYIKGHVSNELKKYKSYLTSDCRNIASEGVSLNDTNEEGSSYSDAITEDKPMFADMSDSSMYVSGLLESYAAKTKNGEAKAKAIYMHLYPDMYDNQEIAEVLGYVSYTANARKTFQRIKQDFRNFVSQTA